MNACENLNCTWFKRSQILWGANREKNEKKKRNHRIGIKINEWNTEPFLMFSVNFLGCTLSPLRWFCSSSAFIVILSECIVPLYVLLDNEWICIWLCACVFLCICYSPLLYSSSAQVLFLNVRFVSISWNWQISPIVWMDAQVLIMLRSIVLQLRAHSSSLSLTLTPSLWIGLGVRASARS